MKRVYDCSEAENINDRACVRVASFFESAAASMKEASSLPKIKGRFMRETINDTDLFVRTKRQRRMRIG